MTCKNHPAVKAKRRCFFCKSGICPRCQIRKKHHLFCSDDCVAGWEKEESQNSPENIKISRQLDQILDITDASLEKNRAELEDRLLNRLQTVDHELRHRLDTLGRELEKSNNDVRARLIDVEQRLQTSQQAHETKQSDDSQAIQEALVASIQELQTSMQTAEGRMQATLEQSRQNFYRGLELTRDRVADLFAAHQNDLQQFVQSQGNISESHLIAQRQGLKELLTEYRQQLDEQSRLTLQNIFAENIRSITNNNLDTYNSIRQENALQQQKTATELKSGFTEQQRQFEALRQTQHDDFSALQNSNAERIESIHKSLQNFLEEDLKRVATEIKFLDRFLDRFRALADEERRNFNDLLKIADQRIAQTLDKWQANAQEVLSQTNKQAQNKFETTLKEIRTAVGERVRLIPKTFQLSPMGRFTVAAVVFLSLMSPIVVMLQNQKGDKPSLTEDAIASIPPKSEKQAPDKPTNEKIVAASSSAPVALTLNAPLATNSRLKLQNAATQTLLDDQGDRRDLAKALDLQLNYLRSELQKDPNRYMVIDGRLFHFNELYRNYAAFREYLNGNPDNRSITAWVQQHFDNYEYQAATADQQLQVTSYYAPELRASHQRSERFKIPIYSTPDDIQSRVPYFTREQIDYGGALEGKAQPIAYLEHDIDRYFLQMQGSGRLIFEDGKQAFVSYDADNGYPFVSLSSLASRDKLKIQNNIGMQGIRDYFAAHPETLQKYAREMRRYIFFSFKKQAVGTLQVPVVPLRTIAVDPKRIPLGLMGFLQTRQPVLNQNRQIDGFKPLSLLVFSHDTGNAITNDHIDLFWGFGDLASAQAGSMNERGKLTLLIPKQ